MEFHLPGNGRVAFRNMHPLLAELVRSLPDLVDRDALGDAAEQRFFPAPTNDPALDDLRADWKAFVEPGLQELFRSNRDVVAADLRSLRERDGLFEVTIPQPHLEAWLNVLNQARLALAAELGFDERLLSANETPDLSNEAGLMAFRVNLYAFMQQCLIEQLG